MFKSLTIISSLFLISCSSGGSDNNTSTDTGPTAKIVILNNMTPTGYVRDGVTMNSIRGSSSAGHLNIVFNFDSPIPYGQSGTITLTSGQCDIFWDLSPRSSETSTIDNTGLDTFFPCNQTKSCTSTIVDVYGYKFGDLEGYCE